MQHLNAFFWVFVGGGIGSVCRFAIGLLAQPVSSRFPWATLAANGLACFALGILVGLQGRNMLSDTQRLLLATGFCGGFSTFSTFTAETWQLWQTGQLVPAFFNLLSSLVVCFFCFWMGVRAVS